MKLIYFSILLILWIPANAAESKIYRTQDADGNIIFSDHAIDDADEIKVSEPITYKPGKITQKLSPLKPQDPKPLRYSKVVIISPGTDEAIRSNNGFLRVEFNISPPLQANHSVELLINGRVIQTTKTASSFEIENVDRGTHSIQINIIDDANGETITSSEARNTTILRYSILLNPRNKRAG